MAAITGIDTKRIQEQLAAQNAAIQAELANPTPGLAPGVMVDRLKSLSPLSVYTPHIGAVYSSMRSEAANFFNSSELRRVSADVQARRARERDKRRGSGLSANLGGGRRGSLLTGLLGLLGDAQTARRTLGGAQ